MALKVLDLFSGIGGFSLGLERTGGFETVAFCEIEPYCQAVLRKHWPEVPIYDDVRKLTVGRLAADGIEPDVICGGFPCQDISVAGKGEGIEGERSGLWSEFARLIGEIRPRFAIVENVSALLSRGMDIVLGDLSALRFDAEWHCIPASAVGAPHRRDRVWIVAYPGGKQHEGHCPPISGALSERLYQTNLADAQHIRRDEWEHAREILRKAETPQLEQDAPVRSECGSPNVANAFSLRESQPEGGIPDERRRPSDGRWWVTEPAVGRVAHGVPSRVDRLKCLGNAVVPQIPEIIGRSILSTLSQEAS